LIFYLGSATIILMKAERIKSFNQLGQGMVEYGLIIGLIVILIVTLFVALNGIVNIGGESSGTLSEEGIGRSAASLSAGIYQ